MTFKKAVLAIFICLAVVLAIPLLRIEKVGYKGKLTFAEKIYAGYLFPTQSNLTKDYKFKDGDVLVMYRPSCSDCKRYMPKIRSVLRGKDPIYLSDKTDLGKALFKANWVPSAYIFHDGSFDTLEIRSDADIDRLSSAVERL